MAETEVKHEQTTKRVVGVLSAIYWRQGSDPVSGKAVRGPVVAQHGEEIDLTADEEKRLDSIGALLPEGSTPEDAIRVQEARLDAYRAERGDQEALQRHQQRVAESRSKGDVVDVDAPVDGSVSDLTAWIKDSKPNADDTVALAEGDPERAQRVLDAETAATGGKPRKTVQEQLEKIIAG